MITPPTTVVQSRQSNLACYQVLQLCPEHICGPIVHHEKNLFSLLICKIEITGEDCLEFKQPKHIGLQRNLGRPVTPIEPFRETSESWQHRIFSNLNFGFNPMECYKLVQTLKREYCWLSEKKRGCPQRTLVSWRGKVEVLGTDHFRATLALL